MKGYQTIKYTFLVLVMAIGSFQCQQKEETDEYLEKTKNPAFLHETIHNLSNTVVNDIFSPPLASRAYLYTTLAAYEILIQENDEYKSLKGQIAGFEGIPKADTSKIHVLSLSAVTAMMEISKTIVYTKIMIEEYETKIYKEYKALDIPNTVFKRSVAYGKEVANAILAYAGTDKYKESRTLMRYSVSENPNDWQPTPPSFMPPIEPNWNTIRPMVLDSAAQFKPAPPTPYNMEKESQFYKELMVVYNTVNDLTEEQGAIAEFWDCNPFAVEMHGHLAETTKKISPGGHWMGIARMASEQSNATLMKSAEAYMATSLALFDGFISCWDEKYRSNLIRPETVINSRAIKGETEAIDLNWKPILQTPPFPEYTSGHSVISAASAVALTTVFGDNFAYIDSVEITYGLPARSYNSFVEASEEAAISRLYGGIHYMPAITNGLTQGQNVGNFIFKNIKLK